MDYNFDYQPDDENIKDSIHDDEDLLEGDEEWGDAGEIDEDIDDDDEDEK